MRLLVLGGSGFLSRAVAEEALACGWNVTTFNRGSTGPDLPGVTAIRGDRYDPNAVDSLSHRGTGWDAAVDCSGYTPSNVLAVSAALARRVDRYGYISSVSAYSGWPDEALDEDSELLECAPDAGPGVGEDVENGPTSYGYQKAGCERAVLESIGPDRSVILRPGVILGPREYVGRLPWWLARIARGGDVVAPGPSTRHIQPIDVRDVAAFALACVSRAASGPFNVAGPRAGTTFADLIVACQSATGCSPQIHWVSDEELIAHGVRQWSELPLWRTAPGVWSVDATRAAAAGLTCRPVAETARDTWDWMTTGGVNLVHERASEIGLTPEHEASLLRARALL